MGCSPGKPLPDSYMRAAGRLSASMVRLLLEKRVMNQAIPDNNILERRVIDNLSTAVLVFDAELKLAYLNPAAEMLFAVSARSVLGQSANAFLPCPGSAIDEKLHLALREGVAFTEREIRLQLNDDREITVNCSVQPLHRFDAADELLVELHQVDRLLRISREEHLLSQQKATQALVRGLAHEIKNPLGGLRGAAQLLERELPDQELREYTRIIIDEADRLQGLMNRMLGPNRVVEEKRINIHQVLERVRQLVRAETGTQVSITRDYDPSIPDIMGDADTLIQALLNIARNGARAAGENGRLVFRTRVMRQFTIGSQRHRLVVLVEIEDNGHGIAGELQERIFLPMVSGSEGGTGLGLTIAQNIVNRHRGLIECRSKEGETVFSVFLPLETGDD
jgi:two-component system nitrogen regulation sensor histidine kinase GlnL